MIKRMRSFFVMLWVLSVSIPLLAQTSSIITTTANTPINVVLTAPEGLIAPLTFVVDTVPQSGRLTGEAPNLFYIPHQDFVGTDSITYSIIDANGNVTSAMLSIVVEAVEESAISLPEATFSTHAEAEITVMLAQGTSYEILTEPQHGSLSGQVPNLSYTPDSFFLGTDSFSYQALVDGELQTFEITIEVGAEALQSMAEARQAVEQEKMNHVSLPGLSPELNFIATEGVNADPGNNLAFAEVLSRITGDSIDVVITSAGDADMAAIMIENAGGTVQHIYAPYIVATVPIGQLANLGANGAISNMRAPQSATIMDPDLEPQYGSITSAGVAASNADEWHLEGYTGTGVKVGIIDGGFDRWENSNLTGCVVEVTNNSGNPYDGTTSGTDAHGTAVAEIVCDMAPGADVYGYSIETDVDFANAVNYLVNYVGVEVLNASLGWRGQRGDGYSFVSTVLNDVVQNDDVVFVVSAGNYYQSHYEAQLTPINVGGYMLHAFNGTNDTQNRIVASVAQNTSYCQGVVWNDWATPYTTDLDLYIWRWNNGSPLLVSSSAYYNNTGNPYEEVANFAPATDTYFYEIVEYVPSGRDIWLQFYNCSRGSRGLEYATFSSSNSAPSTASLAYSAAAVDVNSGNMEYYSSSGPANYHTNDGGTNPFYSTGGNFHPRLSGWANVNTSVDSVFGGLPFNGTSSAAPHITGAIALVRGAFPSFNHAQAEAYLSNRAPLSQYGADPGSPGADTRFGYGYLWLGEPPSGTCDIDTVAIFRDSNFQWYQRNFNSSGYANNVFRYGTPADTGISGDWDGDGVDSVGIWRDGRFYLKNANATGYADISFNFGSSTDIPIAGDWNGDGIDTIGLYRPSTATWFLRNSNSAGAADITFRFGLPNELPVIGDWNGDGIDTIGIFRASDSTWYLRNFNSTGYANMSILYGNPASDTPIVGDWDGDCIDTIGLYRRASARWFLRNSNITGIADLNYLFGLPNETPLAGDWDGN